MQSKRKKKKPSRRKELRSRPYAETATGAAWYDRQQWDRLKEVAADSDQLEDSYDAWLEAAEEAVRGLEATGMLIERVRIDLEELIAWCNDTGRAIDGAARAEFARRTLQMMHKKECPSVSTNSPKKS